LNTVGGARRDSLISVLGLLLFLPQNGLQIVFTERKENES